MKRTDRTKRVPFEKQPSGYLALHRAVMAAGCQKCGIQNPGETTDDLGNMFIQWSSYAYGKNTFGTPAETQFRKSLARMSVTVKNEDTREKDMMSCTDFYSYHGGLITAVHAVQGKRPFSVTGDSSDPEQGGGPHNK